MLRKLIYVLLIGFWATSHAGDGFFTGLIDPETGMLDNSRLKRVERPDGFVPQEDSKVKAIHLDSDNKITVTLKDGTKRIFEKDVFHPEKGWKQTF